METLTRKKIILVLTVLLSLFVGASIFLSLYSLKDTGNIKEKSVTVKNEKSEKKDVKKNLKSGLADKKIHKKEDIFKDEEATSKLSSENDKKTEVQKKRRKRTLDEIIRDLVDTLDL